jgi:DNA invertase Pin-like site-specific DNA recombinase
MILLVSKRRRTLELGHVPDAPRSSRTQRISQDKMKQIEFLVRTGGYTAPQIGKICDVSDTTVRKYFPEVADNYQDGSVSHELLEKIGYMVEDETPISEIARTYNVSTSTIKKYFPNAGVGQGKGASVRAMFKRLDDIADQWGVK